MLPYPEIKDTAVTIKLRILRWEEYPRLYGMPNVITWSLQETDTIRCDDESRGWIDEF